MAWILFVAMLLAYETTPYFSTDEAEMMVMTRDGSGTTNCCGGEPPPPPPPEGP